MLARNLTRVRIFGALLPFECSYESSETCLGSRLLTRHISSLNGYPRVELLTPNSLIVKPRGGEAQYNSVHRNAKMYLLGDYYQLEELQALAVSKIAVLVPIALPTFLGVAEHIYENTAPGGPFRRYFCDQIEKLLPEVASERTIQDLVAKGGDLATDLFLVSDLRASLSSSRFIHK